MPRALLLTEMPDAAAHRPPRPLARQLDRQQVAPPRSTWLLLLCLTLLGYALFSKGWAYLGVPPYLYIGECVLGLGVLAVALQSRWRGVFTAPPFLWLGALVVWGLYRTLPYVEQYGADAFRDAAIWAYAAFAVLVYGCVMVDPTRLRMLLSRYDRFASIYLLFIPLIWASSRFFEASIPKWPWADVPVLDSKGGDVLVHAAGVLAFLAAGLSGRREGWRIFVLAGCVAAVGAYNRGGMLAVLVVFAVVFYLRPSHPVCWQLIVFGFIGLMLLAMSNLRLEIPGKGREMSFQQIAQNISSVVSESDDIRLSGTKEWRLNWWRDIWRYTAQGKYFWGGKGFGINLADDDGYQGTRWEGKLRSPHNGHLTMLARAGVPGFVLWVMLQLSWAARLTVAYRRSSAAGHYRWAGVFLFLGAYWLAFMTNAAFDVFLEGPMGGIWFWTIFGLGLAAVQIYQDSPNDSAIQ